jgi:MFS family permease
MLASYIGTKPCRGNWGGISGKTGPHPLPGLLRPFPNYSGASAWQDALVDERPDVAVKPIDESSLRYAGWRVVAACFVAAVCCWGFGLYSHGIYLAELQRLHGWSASLISGASTAFYLLTATLVVFVSDAIARLGPRRVMLIGASCFASGVALLAFVAAVWQLYVVYLIMAVGAAALHVGAISNVLGLWFDRQRGLAISVALNGASSGGILVAPVLVVVIAEFGFAHAMLGAATVMAAVLLPAIAIWIDRPRTRIVAVSPSLSSTPPRAATWTRPRALRSFAFWSVAAPFALALMAQVGFLVHQIAFLEPAMGRTQAGMAVAVLTIAAFIGRVVFGVFIRRLDARRVAALSLVCQAAALLAMTQTTNTSALFVACAVFGSAAGNLITLPSVIIQREFEAASFGVLVGLSTAIGQFTYAFGPGLLGVVRDATGGYTASLALCMAVEIVAAVLVLARRRAGEAQVP